MNKPSAPFVDISTPASGLVNPPALQYPSNSDQSCCHHAVALGVLVPVAMLNSYSVADVLAARVNKSHDCCIFRWCAKRAGSQRLRV